MEQRAWKGLHSVLCLRPGARSPAKADSERRESADGFAAKMKRTKAETGFTNPVPRFRRRKGSGKNPDGQGTSQIVGADEFFRLRAAKVIELFTKLC